MLKTVAESMAGRVAIIEVGPMTVHELSEKVAFDEHGEAMPQHWLHHYLQHPDSLRDVFAGCLDEMSLPEAVWRGGFPGLIDAPEKSFKRFFDGYLQTYVERDLRITSETDRLVQFENFVAIMAALTAQEISHEKLGREIEAVGKTARRWTTLLQGSYLWREVMP